MNLTTDIVVLSWWTEHIAQSTISVTIVMMLHPLAWHSFRVSGMTVSDMCTIMFLVSHFCFLPVNVVQIG